MHLEYMQHSTTAWVTLCLSEELVGAPLPPNICIQLPLHLKVVCLLHVTRHH